MVGVGVDVSLHAEQTLLPAISCNGISIIF